MKWNIKTTCLVTFIIIQLLSGVVFGQQLSLEWYNRFGHDSWDYANSLKRLSTGDFIITGSIKAEVSGDSLIPSISNNGWIACIDSTGDIKWQKTFLGKDFETVTSVTEINQHVIISGIFQDTTYYDSVSISADSYMNGFYAVIDYDGNLINLNKVGQGGLMRNLVLCSNDDNRAFISGAFSDLIQISGVPNVNSNNSIFFGEIIAPGSIINPIYFHSSGNLSITSAQCNDSTLFIAGSFSDTLFIADSSYISSGSIDAFLVSFNLGGQFKWINTISGHGDQQINDFVIGTEGKIGTVGYFENNAFFDDQVLQTYGSKDMFVSLSDKDGGIIWVKNIGSVSNDRGYSIKMNSENDIYVSGSFIHIIAIPDENGNLIELESFSPFGNSFIAKFNESGILKASYTLPGTSEDYCNGIEVNESGKITAIGNFFKTLNLEGANNQSIDISSFGDKDVFMLHFDDLCKNFHIEAGNDTIICPNQSIVLYPQDNYLSFIWSPGGEVDEPLQTFQTGVYHLTATNHHGCIATDSLLVTDGFLPQVFAGSDTILQAGQNLELFQATGTNSISWLWTTSGDGYFDNPRSINTSYTLSNNDISEGYVSLTLEGNNFCGAMADSLTVSIQMDDDGVVAYPNPTADIVTLVCEEGYIIQSVTVTNQAGYPFISGQPVNSNYFSFNLSAYPPGSYLFYIIVNNTTITKLVNKI